MEQRVVRPAVQADLNRILKIYAGARRFMRQTGNPTQWLDTYPARSLLEEDLADGRLFVIAEEERIHGVFAFAIGPDRTYAVIEDGTWHSERPYGVIHRIAGDGSGGIFETCLNFCRGKCDYLRIDTHENNKVMRHVVGKAGFRRCGIIYTDNGTPRIAFDRLEPGGKETKKQGDLF